MIKPEDAVKKDLKKYKDMGGEIKFPFPVVDFAMLVFGLDVHYIDFSDIFASKQYDIGDLYGALFGDDRYCPYGFNKIVYINENRNEFKIGEQIVPKEYYIEGANRQTIAHETGHYSDYYLHNNRLQLSFINQMDVHDLESIVIYPDEDEAYANKYARNLLMPKEEVIKFINKKDILGTIDLLAYSSAFIEHFGVTRFMIEIRLNELGYKFLNGYYIKTFTNPTKGKPYSEEDMIALLDIASTFDRRINYYDAELVALTYNKLRLQNRSSGALYMLFDRILKGQYDAKYPKVFEKRMQLFG